MQKMTMDGNTAAAYISYAFSSLAVIYPLTPSSPMAELVDEWQAKAKKNALAICTISDHIIKGESLSAELRQTSFTEMMEIALEAGADDVLTEDDCYTVYTAPADFSAVRKFLEAKGINFIEADIEMVPNDYITLDEKQTETFLKMIDALEDSDDVQSIYHNVNLPEEEDED